MRSSLRWFAAAEALIGCSALATPTLLAWLTPLYRQISAARVDDTGTLTLARLACSAAILLIPTTMMGATVPFALRRGISGSHEVAQRAALLYAANTAGALTGALAAGYVLISNAGLTRTMRLAAAVNFCVAAAALVAAEQGLFRTTTAATLRRRVPSLRALAAIEGAIALAALLSMWALATPERNPATGSGNLYRAGVIGGQFF